LPREANIVMPISGRFVVRYGSLLLMVGLICLTGIVVMTVWLGERTRIYAEDAAMARDLRVSAIDLRSALQAAESAQRGISRGRKSNLLGALRQRETSLLKDISRLMTLMSGIQERQAMMRRLGQIVSEKAEEMDRTIALSAEGREGEAKLAFQTNLGKALMDEANVFLSSIIRSADERLNSGADPDVWETASQTLSDRSEAVEVGGEGKWTISDASFQQSGQPN
jgi:CHASE3 domain sensor protein